MAEQSGALHFTEEQQAVIDARGCDLLVSAAAGSGKTAVLAERIVGLVSRGEEPFDIDRILVVTFTRAAAAQMREKIAGALSAQIQRDPGNHHLRRQELLLPHAKIMTIDAFCQYILRNNFDAVDLDPAFRVADEGEVKLLMAEAMEEILEEAYEEGSPAFLSCMEYFAQGADDKACEGEILRIYRFAESMPWPRLWLRSQMEDTVDASNRSFADSNWITGVTERIHRELVCATEELRGAMSLVDAPDGPWMYADTITSDIESLETLCAAADFRMLHETFAEAGELFGRLPSKRDPQVSQEKKDAVKAVRDGVKKLVGRIRSRFFDAGWEELEQREKRAREAILELSRLALVFMERLEEKKREKNTIDFSDLEHLALSVLVEEPQSLSGEETPLQTAIAQSYAEYFQEIMVDEYQDSNYVQELILGAIAGESLGRHDRFMVGDVKQSIYRFRLARPEIFMDKMNRYGRGDGEASDLRRRIDLHRNFRSRPQVLEATNLVFERIMRVDIGGVDYDEDAKLRQGMSFPEAEDPALFSPELLLLVQEDGDASADESVLPEEEDPGEEEQGILQNISADQAEAKMIAARIKRLMAEGRVSDGLGGLRKPRFGDMVILLRATSGIDEVYRDILGAEGIPVYIESRTGYFQTREIRLLLDLLRVLENPLRDIPFAAVLHEKAFGGFGDEELAWIRGADHGLRGASFYEIFVDYAEHGPREDLRDKCADFLIRLQAWRAEAGRLSVRELLEFLLEETGFAIYIAAMPAGARRSANVRMLMQHAASFARSGGHGLSAFISRMEQYRRVEVDFGEANVLSEDADVVRIMSIHKSKGLEFPIVFVAELARRFNRLDERNAVLMDETIGIGSFAVDMERRVRYSTIRRFAIADRLREESLGEELRVLYVAMTRAKEKLILTARVKRDIANALLATAEGGFVPTGAVSYLRRMNAASYFDLLRAALTDQSGGETSLSEGKKQPFLVQLVEQTSLSALQEREKVEGSIRFQRLTDSVNSNNTDRYLIEQIREKLDFHYAHPELAHLFVKTTVTEMKERLLEEEGESYGADQLIRSTEEGKTVPKFLRGETALVGKNRGTAYHKVMELLDAEILGIEDLSREDSINKNRNIVNEWMINQESAGRLPRGYAAAVRGEDILRFLSHDLGRRFTAAFAGGLLHREKQFMMSIDAARLHDDAPKGESVLLQGVIDAWFLEDGEIVLLDYKTDRLPATSDGGELAKKYRMQLDLYAEALERLTGRRVKERYLWSFSRSLAVAVL